MQSNNSADRRREPRFAAKIQALVRHRDGGDSYPAVTLNISAGGLLLRTSQPHPFQVGDEVVCELALPNNDGQGFSSWGVGRVVRASADDTALELKAGMFPLEGEHIERS